MNLLKRYWVVFAFSSKDSEFESYIGLGYGCGVTAYDWDDAVKLMKEKLFFNDPIPEIKEVTENVDVSTLDANHVLPNIGIPIDRGVWFPNVQN